MCPFSPLIFLEQDFSKDAVSTSASFLFLIQSADFQAPPQPVELESPEV